MFVDAIFKPFVSALSLLSILVFFTSYSAVANRVRISTYRMLGASIGSNVVIRPGVLMKGIKNIRIADDVFIGEKTTIVAYNSSVSIGRSTLIADSVYISTMNHRFRKSGILIRKQGFKYESVEIGEDVWLAHGVSVLAGSRVESGVVLAVGMVAPKQTEAYHIYAQSFEGKRE